MNRHRGFTLIELMVVVVIVGVLAMLAIYGIKKYVANSKTAEARNSLGQIAKDASLAYEGETVAGGILAVGSSTGAVQSMCGSASATVPDSATKVKGRKYQSSASEWKVDAAANAGFACLRFTIDEPQYYQYNYTNGFATGNGKGNNGKGLGNNGAPTFQAVANGDLNGDGVLSTFTLTGQVGTTGKAQAALPGAPINIAPNITEISPEE